MCYGILTKYLGTAYDLKVWRYTFSVFLALRAVTFLGLAIANRNTMITESWTGDSSITPTILRVIGGTLLMPAFYTDYSVAKYFAFERLIGGDHFRERYRRMPRVTEGVFKYSSSAIYLFGFMVFWGVAAISNSQAAFGSAFFIYSTIWLHFLCTELPDMKMLYGSMRDVKNGGNVTNLKNPQRATRN